MESNDATTLLRKDLSAREAELVRMNEELDKRKLRVNATIESVIRDQDERIQQMETTMEESYSTLPHQQMSSSSSMKIDLSPVASPKVVQATAPTVSNQRLRKKNSKQIEEKEEESSSNGMGSEATIRYQQARLRVLQEELDQSKEEGALVLKKLEKKKKEIVVQKEEKEKLNKKLQYLHNQLDNEKNLHCVKEKNNLENQYTLLCTEFEEYKKNQKQSGNDQKSQMVRLNRALEDVEKYKTLVKEAQMKNREEDHEIKKNYDKILKENKVLEKQKVELLTAFKKQLKLIDILKRQKIHMEAAKLLSFTEEEFSKTLETT